MWTYLVIFFSLIVVVWVFARKAYLFCKGNEVVEEKAVCETEDEVEKSQLSSKDEDEIKNLCRKAEANLKAGKEEEAIKYFVQALAVDGSHLDTQQKLAMLYLQKQMYVAASALFENLGHLTSDPVHYSHLGLSLFQQNLFEEAKAAYQKAVDLDPSRPARYVSLAQVYKALSQPQNAIIAVNKALELDEDNEDYVLFLKEIEEELGKGEGGGGGGGGGGEGREG